MSCWPQPSLNGTHMTMHGKNRRWSIIAFSSVRNCFFSASVNVGVLLRVRADELPRDSDAAAGHVLPDEQAELVAVVVIAGRLDLDVLAEHVEAELLEHFEVVLHRLVGRRREQPVRPPALIERADLEERLVVEHEAHDALVVLRGA